MKQEMQTETAEFTINDILPVAIVLVVLGIAIAFGLNVMSDIKADFVTGAAGCNSTTKAGCGADYNATEDGIEAVGNIADKIPLLATVVVAAIIIGVLIRYFYVNNMSR